MIQVVNQLNNQVGVQVKVKNETMLDSFCQVHTQMIVSFTYVIHII